MSRLPECTRLAMHNVEIAKDMTEELDVPGAFVASYAHQLTTYIRNTLTEQETIIRKISQQCCKSCKSRKTFKEDFCNDCFVKEINDVRKEQKRYFRNCNRTKK